MHDWMLRAITTGWKTMPKKLAFLIALGCAWAGAPIAAFAHHSFAAEYTRDIVVTVTGTVTRVEWMNPHARFYVQAKDKDDGRKVIWNFELMSPNVLIRQGWTRHSLTVGEKVTVVGWGARNDPHRADTKSVTLASGRTVFSRKTTTSANQ